MSDDRDISEPQPQAESPSESGAPVVVLPAELGIEATAALRDQLAGHLRTDAPVTLAGQAVGRVHTAGLQLLALFCRARADEGRAVVWREPSPSLLAAIDLLGLHSYLNLPRNPS